MKCGGTKKMEKGGATEIVGMPKYGNNPRTQTGAMLEKGGAVKKPLVKAQFGRTVVKSKFTKKGIPGTTDNNDVKEVYNRKGELVKTKIERTTTYDDGEKPLKSKITLKPGKPTVTKFPSLSRTIRIKSDPETGETVKKMGGAKETLVKAKFGAAVKVQPGKVGKIRSASDQGYTAIGKREPARIVKKIFSKKK